MRVQINGTTIHYEEHGAQDGMPVVFIHGFPFGMQMWTPQLGVLPTSIRAIAFDVRGHGRSDVGDGLYSIEFFVDDLIGLLDHLNIGKAVIVGLSMGGYIALRAIERHPDRIRGLVLSNTRSEGDPNEGRVKRAATIKAIKRDGVNVFADGFLKAVFGPASFESNPSAVQMIRSIIEQNSPIGICGTLLALAARTDTTASLATIGVPTLILVGEHDTLTPPAASASMHEKIIGSEYHIVPNAAHMGNLENPQFFNEKLFSFLKRIS